MNKLMMLFLAVSATVAGVAVEKQRGLPIARITLCASDEEGGAISNANVRIGFDEAIPHWGGGKVVEVKGTTNNEGCFTGEGHSVDRLGGQVEKDGYYAGLSESVKFREVVAGRWQPWNPTLKVVLKRVNRPIPMYARFKFTTQIPMLDQPIGFDLIEADWVAPYGRGKSSDLVFGIFKRVASFNDFGAELTVSFPNKGDGIQEMRIDGGATSSELRSAQIAPHQDYIDRLAFRQGNSLDGGKYGMKNDEKNYYFRVRTVMDDKGNIVSALYGKIYDGIEYFPVESKTAKVRFTYYINPTPNDRGMEFERKRSLFTNLKDGDQPNAP
jgi:hypothetical protein